MTWFVMPAICVFSRLVIVVSLNVYLISDLGLQRAALAGPPDILISTPACVAKCLSGGVLQGASISGSLETLVLDEVKNHM